MVWVCFSEYDVCEMLSSLFELNMFELNIFELGEARFWLVL